MVGCRRLWLVSMVALAFVGAACGTGRAIITVDILSFIVDQTLGDTIPYLIPASSNGSVDRAPFSARLLPGAAQSAVDSLQLSVGVTVWNYAGGPGTVTLITFFGDDSSTVYTNPTQADTTSQSVSGPDTVLFGHGFRTISRGNDTSFTSKKIWVGLRTSVNNTGSQMTGRLQLGELQLRIFLKDKVF